MKTKPELVLPGGDRTRAKIALDFGADAVYIGLNKYSLRKGEVRFNLAEIKKTVEYAHSIKKKIYVTFNIFAHNKDLADIKKDIKKVASFGPDAFIIADPGVFMLAKKIAPEIPIHISTQANVTNIEDVRFWQKLGAKRVVLARELTLKEISEIKKAVPKMELEIFVHGSMCISYSGRCLLSNYMTARHANLGDCSQPCRWGYNVYLEEKNRPGEYFVIEESEVGANIMSSKDLRLIRFLPEILKAGVTGLKVEGRNKTEYYLATCALAYHEALGLITNRKYSDQDKTRLEKELEKIAHRGYTTGFLSGDAKKGETYQSRSPIQKWEYIGQITSNKLQMTNQHEVIVKNKITKGDRVEILTTNGVQKDKVLNISVNGEELDEISPGKEGQKAIIVLKNTCPDESMLRIEK